MVYTWPDAHLGTRKRAAGLCGEVPVRMAARKRPLVTCLTEPSDRIARACRWRSRFAETPRGTECHYKSISFLRKRSPRPRKFHIRNYTSFFPEKSQLPESLKCMTFLLQIRKESSDPSELNHHGAPWPWSVAASAHVFGLDVAVLLAAGQASARCDLGTTWSTSVVVDGLLVGRGRRPT